jgi:TonB-dependent receptor
MRRISLFALIFVACYSTLLAQTGTIRGEISDATTGEPLMFTNVLIKNTDPPIGAQTDLDGNYQLTVEPGTYSLEVSYVGYAVNTITDVKVQADSVTIIDFPMEEESQVLQEVVVQATRIDRTENALLAIQKRASTIQDGISAQEISRYGSSNAAESMKRVTGASVVDGKYVVVRGLGDRYSAAQLNGLPLPSTDPYRNSTQLDLIPANLMDNLIASKTFTPNQPGNFTGGNVDINTKSFPERFTMSASLSTSYNDQSSFQDNFLTYEGGDTDWLGYDDGTRDIPEIYTDPEIRSQMRSSLGIRARRDEESAALLDETAKATSKQIAPAADQSFTNYGVSFSIGNQYQVGNNPLGFLLGLNYNRRFEHYDNGRFGNWDLLDPNAPALANETELNDTRSTESPNLGGLLGIAYKIGGSQKITFNALYNHDAEKSARYLIGAVQQFNGLVETRSIIFRERELQSYQLGGEHVIGEGGFRIDWSGAYVQTTQDEPDLRLFANNYFLENSEQDTTFAILPQNYQLPFHFFRELEDQQWIGKVDFTIPFAQEESTANKIQFGALYQTKDRDFTEERFQYNITSNVANYEGDPDFYFSDANRGILGQNPNNGQNIVGLFLTDETEARNSYTGTETIYAGYGMITYDWNRFKIIAGARVEGTDIEVISADTTRPVGRIDQLDFLPSINAIYRITDDMNLRASFTQTLARPNMRELAPFESFDFLGDFLYTGNPNVNRTLIRNYDLRWELYPQPGELIAVSAYYKDFFDPIILEFVAEAANKNEIRYTNQDEAIVYGAEFEIRKNLGFLASFLRNFKFTTNLSIINSRVDIPEIEQENIKEFNPEKGDTRQFQGQSPFLLNVGLNYVDPDAGLDAIISFNVFGERLDAISFGGRPDIFEQPQPQLDFSLQKSLGERFGMKITATNLLNPNFRREMEFKGQDFIISQFRRGRTFGLSLSYTL